MNQVAALQVNRKDRDAVLGWLQNTLFARGDVGRGPSFGVTIDTLDTPGWSVVANVSLQKFPRYFIHRDEFDWVDCRIEDGRFVGLGGPGNLVEMLGILRQWSESGPNGISARRPER